MNAGGENALLIDAIVEQHLAVVVAAEEAAERIAAVAGRHKQGAQAALVTGAAFAEPGFFLRRQFGQGDPWGTALHVLEKLLHLGTRKGDRARCIATLRGDD